MRTCIGIFIPLIACGHLNAVFGYRFPFTLSLRAQFEQLFEDKCAMKHSTLLERFVRSLEYPAEKQFIFVFQEPELDNGGFGDRLAGLVSAVTMSLRFNRTLIIKDGSGLSRYFRPYHPVDIKSSEPRFTWDNYLQWSKVNTSLARNLTKQGMCVNIIPGRCSLDNGDVSFPLVLYRGNRAYLRHYEMTPNISAHRDWRNLLGISARDDLFEVAGCLLRLALWPTEELWEAVDNAYVQEFGFAASHQHLFQREGDEKHKNQPLNRTEKPGLLSADRNSTSENHRVESFSLNRSVRQKHLHEYFQVAVHFRCGDDFLNGYNASCRYDPNRSSPVDFDTGSPVELAACSVEILRNHSQRQNFRHQSVLIEENEPLEVLPAKFLSLFVSSDNPAAAEQIREVANYSRTLTSPTACHINLSPTQTCLSSTVVYWFVLSLSHHLVTPVPSSYFPLPISGFLRFAGIYGLRTHPFYSGKTCRRTINTRKLSRISALNWL